MPENDCENTEKAAAGSYYGRRRAWYRQLYWPRPHNDIFLPNGIDHQGTAEMKYRLVLASIQRHGAILDLGCGNGLLLRFLMHNSAFNHTPFGVDFIDESIRQARTQILPDFEENFTCENIIDFNFDRNYDFIILQADCLPPGDFIKYVMKLLPHIEPEGKLILLIQEDTHRGTIAQLRQLATQLTFQSRSNAALTVFEHLKTPGSGGES